MVSVVKQLKPTFHFYFPEASCRGNKIDLCEHFYIKHSFQRKISNAIIRYYAKDHQKEFNKAIRTNSKKKSEHPEDLFYIVLDTDISANRSNINSVIEQITKLNQEYKNDATIILSSRSFEVWLCMYGRQNYTSPFISQEKLNQDVKENYEKKESWYIQNAERLYNDSQSAVQASILSKKIVFSTTSIEPPEGHDLVNELPDLSCNAVKIYLANTAPYTYFEHIIMLFKVYE